MNSYASPVYPEPIAKSPEPRRGFLIGGALVSAFVLIAGAMLFTGYLRTQIATVAADMPDPDTGRWRGLAPCDDNWKELTPVAPVISPSADGLPRETSRVPLAGACRDAYCVVGLGTTEARWFKDDRECAIGQSGGDSATCEADESQAPAMAVGVCPVFVAPDEECTPQMDTAWAEGLCAEKSADECPAVIAATIPEETACGACWRWSQINPVPQPVKGCEATATREVGVTQSCHVVRETREAEPAQDGWKIDRHCEEDPDNPTQCRYSCFVTLLDSGNDCRPGTTLHGQCYQSLAHPGLPPALQYIPEGQEVGAVPSASPQSSPLSSPKPSPSSSLFSSPKPSLAP